MAAAIGRVENYHGPAGSPLLYKNSVILYQDQRSGSFVAAFDKATGKQLWRTPRDAQVGWGTPIAVRVVDHDEMIVHGQNRVLAYNPDTGAELWRCGGSTFEVIPTPVVGYGMLFCSSGRAGPTLAIRPGGKGDVTSTHVAWTTPRGSPFVPSPILFGDLLYTVNDMQSIVTAFDARTGASLWQGRLGVAHARGVLRVARRGGRQGVLHQRRRRDVRAAGRHDVRAAARQPHRRADAGVAGAGGRPLVHPDRAAPLRDRREVVRGGAGCQPARSGYAVGLNRRTMAAPIEASTKPT